MVTTEPTNAAKLRGLPWDILQSAANSIFVQLTFFGSIFVLFLSELGLSKTAIGSVLSLLPFTGLVALFIAPAAARFGYKRTFVWFWGIRKVVAIFLLLTPWVMDRWGPDVTLIFVAVIVTIFALCRSVGMTARLPWVQEFVPDSVRGKFAAISNTFAQLTAFVSIMLAGVVIERSTGLDGFIILFGAGVAFGLVSVWAASHIPGGQPAPQQKRAEESGLDFRDAARDSNFVRFLLGLGLMTLAGGPVASFIPLFMQEQVGLKAGNVVWLQNGALLGGLLSGVFWGWLADRYGSKPVMMSGYTLKVLLPIFWLFMPRQSVWSLYVALGIALVQGVGNVGWMIGSARLRFVSVIPQEKKRDYQALYFAWIGIIGGLGQLVGGRLLDATAGITGRFLVFDLNSYTVLFFFSLALLFLAGALLQSVRGDSQVSIGEFAAMFVRGNPVMAMESLIRFHRARDERAAVSMTERLGRTGSPLTVEELLEALSDPRFAVRFEAVVSIARRDPDPNLLDALVKLLDGDEPALSTVAAWALGRIGDDRAIEPLRGGLGSRYRSVQAHCARALGTLADKEIESVLLARLSNETDVGLQLAYASALGKLGTQDAVGRLLSLLREYNDESLRHEMALAVARVIGHEHNFVQLLRRTQDDAGTTVSQVITALKKTVTEFQINDCDLIAAMEACAEAFAHQDLTQGVELLGRVNDCLPVNEFSQAPRTILQDCAECLAFFGAARLEYVLLALHAISVGLAQRHVSTFTRVFGQ